MLRGFLGVEQGWLVSIPFPIPTDRPRPGICFDLRVSTGMVWARCFGPKPMPGSRIFSFLNFEGIPLYLGLF